MSLVPACCRPRALEASPRRALEASEDADAARVLTSVEEYRAKYDLDAILNAAITAASRSGATNPYAAIAAALAPRADAAAVAPLKTKDVANSALSKMGILKHEAPEFEHFDPVREEQIPVLMKEVKLPRATETHEAVYEPVSKCVFVTQMSNSVLVRIPVGEDDGLLMDDQDAWRIGPVSGAEGDGISGLHNVSLSTANPGCLWLSLQFANTLILLDAVSLLVRQVIRVPTYMTTVRIGGPHAVSECPLTGRLWVALKGSVSCCPVDDTGEKAKGSLRIQQAVERTCCSSGSLQAHMSAMSARGYDCPPPEGFAIWRLDDPQTKYDPKAKDRGGVLYPCLGSPPMVAVDRAGNCWVAQDQAPSIMRIDAKTNGTLQLDAPFAAEDDKKITGPAIATAPDGSVWFTLLGSHASLVRVDTETNRMTLHQIPTPNWCKELRLIHLAFSSSEENIIYALSSDLLDDGGLNSVLMLHMDPTWRYVVARRVVPLPTQDCCCHRVAILAEGMPSKNHSIVVTEMASSKLAQFKTANLTSKQGLTVQQEVYMKIHSRCTYTEIADEKGAFC